MTIVRNLALLAVLLAATAPAQLKNATYQPGQLARVPGEAVVVSRFGVSPAKIVRGQGPFLLLIMNRFPGHAEHFSIALDQANAPTLVGLSTSSAAPTTSTLLDLMPGTYRVSFQNQTNLSFTIEIQQ